MRGILRLPTTPPPWTALPFAFSTLPAASEASPVILAPGSFLPVNTGNAVPDPYNAVVMIEDVHQLDDGSVELINPAPPWQHIRTIGEDIVATELILPEGHRIRPIDQGAMIASGVTEVEVVVPPKVVVIPTGSELITPGSHVEPGQIIEFNSRILAGYIRTWGGEATTHPPVNDEPEKLQEAITKAAESYEHHHHQRRGVRGNKGFLPHLSLAPLEISRSAEGWPYKPGKPVIPRHCRLGSGSRAARLSRFRPSDPAIIRKRAYLSFSRHPRSRG